MNWKKLFTPGEDLSAAQAKAYMTTKAIGEYQLLDVRQPNEYAAGHLAGALLIPLKELPERLHELQTRKPVLVYCAVGGRSKVAAQLLAGQGFDTVYNIAGGIKAWLGDQAVGPEWGGLEFFTGQEEYEDGLSLAYAMEKGLHDFYQGLAERAEEAEAREIYLRLMGFEERHQARLLTAYRRLHGDHSLPPDQGGAVIEGGERARQLLAQLAGRRFGATEILEFAMALETQALDLYLRMARKSELAQVGELFEQLAAEEKMHLSWLSDELDKLLAQG